MVVAEALAVELLAVVAVPDAVRQPVAEQRQVVQRQVVQRQVVLPLAEHRVVDAVARAEEQQPVAELPPVVERPVVERKVAADAVVAVALRQQLRRKNWVKASTRSRAAIAWSLSSLKTTLS